MHNRILDIVGVRKPHDFCTLLHVDYLPDGLILVNDMLRFKSYITHLHLLTVAVVCCGQPYGGPDIQRLSAVKNSVRAERNETYSQ